MHEPAVVATQWWWQLSWDLQGEEESNTGKSMLDWGDSRYKGLGVTDNRICFINKRQEHRWESKAKSDSQTLILWGISRTHLHFYFEKQCNAIEKHELGMFLSFLTATRRLDWRWRLQGEKGQCWSGLECRLGRWGSRNMGTVSSKCRSVMCSPWSILGSVGILLELATADHSFSLEHSLCFQQTKHSVGVLKPP